ncbi:hypothetical protein [Butyricimonas virosa]|uniref:hypothetical protein n=2 Tax=Butyricimonas TaxID=574697 RepID=UPI0039F5C7BB
MSLIKVIYLKSPVWIQNIMCSLQGWIIQKRRYSKSFFEELRRYEGFYYKPEKCLRGFLEDIKEVPYYKSLFEKLEINIYAVDIHEELTKVPIINREEIINNYDQIINKAYRGKTIQLGSSGTTGTALVFPCSIERERKQWAIWWRYRRRLGLDFGMWCGWFGGKVVVPIDNKKAPFWRINYPGKQLMFSAFHMNSVTIKFYYDEIVKRNLKWLHGHAHNITYLSSLILEQKLQPIECVEIITTGADSLFDWQKQIIKEAFNHSQVYQHYGLSEGVANISETKEGNLEVDEDFGYVEFIPLDETDPSLCRIIATGFSNQPFPFVRYDTGDLATIGYNNGRTIIKQIDGRVVDCIKLPDGRRISSTSMTNFEFTTKVKEVQFYQKDLYNIYVRLVRRDGYDQEEEQKVIKSVRERLPDDVNVHIEYVESVERTKTGKIRYILSDIK